MNKLGTELISFNEIDVRLITYNRPNLLLKRVRGISI